MHLANKMGNLVGGGGVSGRIHGEGERGREGNRMKEGGQGDNKVENKCDFSCRQKEAMSFAWWTSSSSLFQRVGAHCGTTLLLNIFCSYSRQIQRHSVCTGKRSGENRADCVGKLVPVDTVVPFYVHNGMRDRFCTKVNLFENWQPVRWSQEGVMWSPNVVLVTIRAAAFWMFCRWFNWLVGRLHRVLLQQSSLDMMRVTKWNLLHLESERARVFLSSNLVPAYGLFHADVPFVSLKTHS